MNEQRNEEMKRLHFTEAWTLQEIGEKYGVTRERVRQIIGGSNGGRRAASEKIELPKDVSLNVKNLIDYASHKLPRILKKVLQKKIASQHHATVSKGCMRVGENGELAVHLKLEQLGIKNQLMPFGKPFDILLENGIRVDVKTCQKEWKGNRNKSTYYHFSTRKDLKDDCDFFVLYAVKGNRFWVIPSAELPKTNAVYIKHSGEQSWKTPKYEEWNKYENRFDLLK